MADRRGAFIYRDSMSRHVLREDHVFKPVRLRYTYELLEECGAFQVENGRLVDPRKATDEEVQTFHTPDYVAAVKAFGEGRMLVDPSRYNFSQYGDNPTYPGMFDAGSIGGRGLPDGGGHDSGWRGGRRVSTPEEGCTTQPRETPPGSACSTTLLSP